MPRRTNVKEESMVPKKRVVSIPPPQSAEDGSGEPGQKPKHASKPVSLRAIAKRWSPSLAHRWTGVSDYFLENYHRIKPASLTHGEAMLIVHLMKYKWDELPPYPSFKVLSTQMGISMQQARKLARSIERKGLMRREIRPNTSNRFHLEPLFDRLGTMLTNEAAAAVAPKRKRHA
jgi:hypothetical protein